jgi:DNA polymerase (family 10)
MAARAPPSNVEIAGALEDLARVLEAQDANAWRVRAYAEAARTIRGLDRPAAALLAEGGRKALEALPTIGRSIASAIEELVRSGRLPMLERLAGGGAPEDLFTVVPGIGEELARRIHEDLGVESLEELERAAHDGRLATVEGLGPRRVRAIREVLGAMLSRSSRRHARAAALREEAAEAREPPPVALCLEVDARYRRLAEAGSLRRIAPRRFNPTGEAWLPILHGEDGGWAWTAMWSNTARAHELGRTRDWVVLYHERDGAEGQCTVVTETRGALEGRRVVRGRERECERHYAGEASA